VDSFYEGMWTKAADWIRRANRAGTHPCYCDRWKRSSRNRQL